MEDNSDVFFVDGINYSNGHLTLNTTSKKPIKTITINVNNSDSTEDVFKVTKESIENDKVKEIFEYYNSKPNNDIPKKRSLDEKTKKNVEKALKSLRKLYKAESSMFSDYGLNDEYDLAKKSVDVYAEIMSAHQSPNKPFFWGYSWNITDFFCVGNKPRFERFIPGGDMFSNFEKYKREVGFTRHVFINSEIEDVKLDEEDSELLNKLGNGRR